MLYQLLSDLQNHVGLTVVGDHTEHPVYHQLPPKNVAQLMATCTSLSKSGVVNGIPSCGTPTIGMMWCSMSYVEPPATLHEHRRQRFFYKRPEMKQLQRRKCQKFKYILRLYTEAYWGHPFIEM